MPDHEHHTSLSFRAVQHSSPSISYSPEWLDTPIGPNFPAHYSGIGFHTTHFTGAIATFTFTGTGVWFYGSRQPDGGNYTLTLNDQPPVDGDSSCLSCGEILGGFSELNFGEHTATLISAGGPMEFDSIIFEANIGGYA